MINEVDKANDIKWWNNPTVIDELEKEYKTWESGKEKGHSWNELKTEIARRKAEKMHRSNKIN